MPMPQEYQRAGQAFERFLEDARVALGHTTRNQAFTTVQSVLLVFRRRLTAQQVLRFADVLPAVVRAIFVAEWTPQDQPVAFASRDAMGQEVQALRQAHNFAPPTAMSDVARTLSAHVDARAFEAVLRELPPEAAEFWTVAD